MKRLLVVLVVLGTTSIGTAIISSYSYVAYAKDSLHFGDPRGLKCNAQGACTTWCSKVTSVHGDGDGDGKQIQELCATKKGISFSTKMMEQNEERE
jgi:hypothetical protein